jgi:UDP-N-acetylglucosamine 1-carboxyvinyltransferase
VVPATFSGKHRIPILLAGPLLHRLGYAEIPVEGGDRIGPRPVNFHIAGYRAMGVEVEEKENTIVFKADKLHGAVIDLPYPSVMTTESLLLAAVMAEGKTVIKNAAIEPEIIELVDLLQKMGAIIFLEPERTFVVEGVAKLNGAEHRIAPDRIEAASFACAAIATKGSVLVRGVSQHGMRTFLNMLRKIGGAFEINNDGIWFYSTGKMKGITLETGTHPGFMTDWQPPFSLLLTQAEGMSVVHETVHEKRFGYYEGLKKMGADVNLLFRWT